MKKLQLFEQFGSLIITRNAIRDLFDSLADGPIVLDFNGIEFISRSAAHEYIRGKTSSPYDIKEINMSKNIRAMFILVAKQLKNIVN
ncbi:MAG: hypothetical protein Q8P57_04190 [Candidatus Pacearchaeota archaeon]|nr:hypothetical protein [Candidatus Pacearchaeota archaeon]